MSRPTRSVKYKAMAKVPCNKCESSFVNKTQLEKHRKTMHSKGGNDSIRSIKYLPMVDDLSLIEISEDEKIDSEEETLFKCDCCDYKSYNKSTWLPISLPSMKPNVSQW